LADVLAALEALPLAAALRGSVWLYPLVNAAHIVGVALLFGAIVPLDLRFMGVLVGIDASALSRLLVPVSVFGFIVALGAGSLLFITDAPDYFASSLFRVKMLVLLLALANVVIVSRLRARAVLAEPSSSTLLRLAATASIGLWLTVIVLGRLVGYF